MKRLVGGYECVVCALSDVGLRRAENQDAWFADQDQGLFLVADGMGGQNAGVVASKAAADILPKLLLERLAALERPLEKAVEDAIREAVADFSAGLGERAGRDPRLQGTGTTVVLALVRGRCAYVANLGDSRAYLMKGNGLRRLTEDHSVAALMLRLGKITVEEARTHPGRNTLTRHAGMEGKAQADVRMLHLKGACRMLLCTDGLTGMLADERIREVLSAERDGEAACRRLVDEANEAGGADNVTAMVVDLRHPG
ncbi:MAG: serine/threonine-protein phosphatase [Elusimicrobia bacterium]|nr:serine/threonine-protein phosphatase [Elusimicrobiota bacterium]